ncbi:MAG: hypothetical protein MUO60_05285 [Clostridiaceae bacterium]|nr:hypothetical protein [Clostridiaceae bacterium]
MEKYVYVVISRTSSYMGKIIRKVIKGEYNHASISLNENLSQMYSFSRLAVSNPLVGGIIRESVFTLTIGLKDDVPINIYRIPVTPSQYEHISEFIYDTYNDDEIYYYNILQAIGLISNKKHVMYKTYICTEFVMEALRHGGINLTQIEPYVITPTGICEIMARFIHYSGNLSEYPMRQKAKTKEDEIFLCKTGFLYEIVRTLKHLWKIMRRDKISKRL